MLDNATQPQSRKNSKRIPKERVYRLFLRCWETWQLSAGLLGTELGKPSEICTYTKHYSGSLSISDVLLDVVHLVCHWHRKQWILVCLFNLFCSFMWVLIETTTVTLQPQTENLLSKTDHSKYFREKQICFKNFNKCTWILHSTKLLLIFFRAYPLGHRYPFLCSFCISSTLWAIEYAFQFLKSHKLVYDFITWSCDMVSITKCTYFTNVLCGEQNWVF